jgi:hypothetical protein
VWLLILSPRACALEPRETALAVVRAGDDTEYLVTDQSVLVAGRTWVRYGELAACHWITDNPDAEMRSRSKVEFFDQLVLKCKVSRRVVLSKESGRMGPPVD